MSAKGTTPEALAELETSLEELHVAGEELKAQNEELALTRADLEAERQQYHDLFEFAPDGYLVTDEAGTIRKANRAAAALLNVSQQFLIGKPLINYIQTSERQNFRSKLNQLCKTNQQLKWEVRVSPRDNAAFDAALTVSSFRDGSGRPVALRWLLRDITERKRAEAEIRTLNAQLEQRVSYRTEQLEAANRCLDEALCREQAARVEAEAANRMKDEFLAIVSHELRSPLNAMLGWARLLRERKFNEATTARAIDIIERNARLQTNLIEDLLDVSRIIRGQLSLQVHPVNLVQMIEAAINTVKPAADAKAIRLESVLEPNFGSVWADANRLQQVLSNLLSNAIKFTPKGGRVELRLERSRDAVEITVKDTGIGINPDFLPYIFDRFRQADTTSTRSHGGLGLGLAIVHHLVELHGGIIHAESGGEGQGAKFTVQLPICQLLRGQAHVARNSNSPAP